MSAWQIVTRPQYFAIRCIEACRTVTAKVDVHAARFNGRRWRRVAIHGIAQRLRIRAVEQPFVVNYCTGLRIDANDKELVTVLGGGGKPDLAVENDGRGPTAMGDGRFPADVFCLAPLDGQAAGRGLTWRGDMSVAEWAAKFGPGRVRARCERTKYDKNRGG